MVMTARDVAGVFIDRHSRDMYITYTTLTILVYYCQVEAIRDSIFHRPLFDDTIHVERAGRTTLPYMDTLNPYGSLSGKRISTAYRHKSSWRAKRIVDKVYEKYGKLFTAFDLVTYFYRPNSAWYNVYKLTDRTIITVDDILNSGDSTEYPSYRGSFREGLDITEEQFKNTLALLADS